VRPRRKLANGGGAPARKSEPWYDQSCKDAYQHKKRVSQCPQSTAEQIKVAQTRYDSVTSRAKQIWMQRRNDELVEKSNKDSRHFWKVCKTRKRNSCPVSLPEQKEAFQTLYGAQPAEPPQRPATSGVSATSSSDDECMFASITAEELHVCIKKLKRGKSPGIDGVSADMVIDGGDLLHDCLLQLFNRMLATSCPECLSIGMITAVFKSGEKSDMSNYRGITVGPVFAKLFAMIIERRLASWAEEHGIKARGQADFRKNYRTTDNIFVLRSLIDKQKQARQKGGSGKLYCCFVDLKRRLDTVPRALLWQVLEDLGVQGRVLDITIGVKYLVAAGKKAVHAMRRRCISLHLSDPATICKLFDILVLPILSYSCEVWAVNPKVGAKAELLHRQFLKQLLGVRKSTTNQIVLAEFERFPLPIHFWQQILRYHNRVRALPNSWLDKLALIDGFWDSNPPHRVEALSGNWRSDVRRFTETLGQQIMYDELDISIIVEREKARRLEDFLFDTDHSSLQLYRTVYKANQSVYQYSDYLSTVRCYPHGRLISRFRCGCQGLHVDTGFGKDSEHCSREDRVCLVCMSGSVENEHHFLFDCPAYSHIHQQYSHHFHQASSSVAAFLAVTNPMWQAVISRLVLHKDNLFWPVHF